MIRVLFVCLGNICRSPMAEAVFLHLVKEAGLQDKIEADSAGTGDWHIGANPHRGTQRILARNAINYTHQSRQIGKQDFDSFDYFVVMDNMNFDDVLALGAPSNKVSRLLEYVWGSPTLEVPDPYYTDRFDEVYELVKAGCEGLLARIRADHSL
jgi:protein-tyrosine phosphatase